MHTDERQTDFQWWKNRRAIVKMAKFLCEVAVLLIIYGICFRLELLPRGKFAPEP